jgi:CRAL/TRIO domain/CRAL/TRIO, N-terminal domain
MATVEVQSPVESKDGGDILTEKVAVVESTETEVKPEDSDPKAAVDDNAEQNKQSEATTPDDKAEDAPAKTDDDPRQAKGPLKEPIARPLETCKPDPPPELTPEMLRKYDEVLAAVKAWTDVPASTAASAARSPLTDDDRLFLTRECLLRYLRASKWDAPTAVKRLTATLAWRREYGLLGFTHAYISPENETGKQVILGYDDRGRPALYLNPSKQNTERTDRQLQHLFYNIERVIDLMGPGQESMVLLVNFMDTRRGQGGSIGQASQTMSVLQNHYPERLGRALLTERECRLF